MRVRVVSCVLVVGAFASVVGCGPSPPADDAVLRVAVPREPSTWNRLLAPDIVTNIVTDQLHAPLIRLDPVSQKMEAGLARAWEFSQDGTELVLRLREGVRFSDGEPFGAEDVVFTFQALHDPRVASPLADTARIDGEPLFAEEVDGLTVRFRLPRRTATVERIFDSIRILPEHVLGESLTRGTMAADTGLGAPAENIVGLGPFRLREHVPGQRVVLEKNPHYFKAERGLPRLSGLVFEVVPDDQARVLRLRAGEIDAIEPLTVEGFRQLAARDSSTLVVKDLGPSLASERFWLNLHPDSPIDDVKKKWFGDIRFRRAISLAIDREGLARVVFYGLASPAAGPVSPANRFWHNDRIEPTGHDPEAARRLLADAGFRAGAAGLVDRAGNAVRFTILTNADSEQRRREAAFIQEDLRRIGIDANLAPVEGGTLYSKITSTFDYEACLLGFTVTDPDPSAELSLWLSHAPLHLWHPGQSTPATEWEARVDELMEAQVGYLDREHRKASFDEVQRIVAEKLPLIHLVVPHALVGHSARLRGVRATPLSHSLWNSDEISVARGVLAPNEDRDRGH